MKKELKKLYETTKKSLEKNEAEIYRLKQKILNRQLTMSEYVINKLLELQKDKCYLESSLRNIKTMCFELKEYK